MFHFSLRCAHWKVHATFMCMILCHASLVVFFFFLFHPWRCISIPLATIIVRCTNAILNYIIRYFMLHLTNRNQWIHLNNSIVNQERATHVMGAFAICVISHQLILQQLSYKWSKKRRTIKKNRQNEISWFKCKKNFLLFGLHH